jgi:hypothetical protein
MSDDDWDVSDSEAAAAPPQKIVSKWDDEDADENDVKVEGLRSSFSNAIQLTGFLGRRIRR